MRRTYLTLLLTLILAATAMAQYAVRSASTGVKIKSGTTVTNAAEGAKLRGADRLIIPSGGKVEILNTANKKIYSSTSTGEISVFDLMMAATKASGDHAGTVGSRLNFGKSSSGETASATIFKEKGVVRRSMAVYDPEAKGIEMDAATLGRFLASKVAQGDSVQCGAFPLRFAHSKNAEKGLSFHVENTLSYPVYFNIIKVDSKNLSSVEISRLGQPDGIYVLLPEQSMAREHFPKVAESERHILIMAPCQYDIDTVIEEMKKSLSAGATGQQTADLPVFVSEL